MPKIVKEWSLKDLKSASPGVHFVGGVGGLTLHIKPASKPGLRPPASWVIRVYIDGKRRNLGLGPYPEISLAEARTKALELKTLCSKGIDPVDQRRETHHQSDSAKQQNKTFKQVAEEYLTAHALSNYHEKHTQQWKSSLVNYAFPVLGSKLIKDIVIDDVLAALRPIWEGKTETASRLQRRMERIFDLAITSGLVKTNPARWRNYLSVWLPSPSRVAKVEHYPSVPYQHLDPFMEALKAREGNSARALEFLILTAVRSRSVRLARWSEIDFQALEWRIPRCNTKTRKVDHRVPLTPQMVSLLKAIPRRLDTDLIFPSPTGKILSDMSLNSVMRKMRKSGELEVDAVPHGFRSTFRVWAAEATTYPAELAELVLMHTVGSSVYQAYQRSDLFEKRRDIMRDWNETVFKRSEKVIAFA